MPSTAAFGPWPKGLNLTSNRDLSPYLQRDELGVALNVQLTREGFVESRPGFKILEHALNEFVNPIIKILGSILVLDQEVVVLQVQETTNTHIYYIKGDKTVVLKATFASTPPNFSSVLAIKQSDATAGSTVPRGVFLFSATADDKCYRLEETPSFTAGVTPLLMASSLKVPKSDFSFSIKDRIFLVDATKSKLYWSALVAECLFFDIAELSGGVPTARALEAGFINLEPSLDAADNIKAVVFINNSFYLFKKTKTFLFSFQADPEADGYLRKISDELGALGATTFRDTIAIINPKGVFAVNGTDFVDLQRNLNLPAENFIDSSDKSSVFITTLNDNLLIGYESNDDSYYYILNGYTNGWTQWSFDYALPDVLAAPGSAASVARLTTDEGIALFVMADKKRVVFCHLTPGHAYVYGKDYALDTQNKTTVTLLGVVTKYVPTIDIQTQTHIGDSVLNIKKIYRSYVRLYLSDIPAAYNTNYFGWRFSINYNNFLLNNIKNPIYRLIVTPHEEDDPLGQSHIPAPLSPAAGVGVNTAVYKRTYQIPFSQQRVREFTFQLKRDFSKLTSTSLKNPEKDRDVQEGFYFLLSGFWSDYDDKARI